MHFFDVDGVRTDGSKLYSSDKGSPVIGKRFNDIDFTAFKILKCLDIDFYWISGDETVNKTLAENRSIKFNEVLLNSGLLGISDSNDSIIFIE